jgi:hypothetical protein
VRERNAAIGLLAQSLGWHHVTDLNIIVKLAAAMPANSLDTLSMNGHNPGISFNSRELLGTI